MAFRSTDFKKTARKGRDGQPAALYPHQLKDKKTRANLAVAIRLFDQMVGKRKGDMNAAALVDFFGDPRLARGIVACLGQYYHYRAQSFAEIVGKEKAAELLLCGLSTPIAVRAHTYAHLNTHTHGFAAEAERPALYAQIAAPYGLTARDWDTLLHADADENQLLTRPGSVPDAADIAALYNFHALDTVLKRAAAVTLTNLQLTSAQAADARRAAKMLGTHAAVTNSGTTLTLTPCPADADGKRPPVHMARAALLLMHAHATRAAAGHIAVTLSSRPHQVALTRDTFRALGCPLTENIHAPIARRLATAHALHRDLLRLRAKGRADGWHIKRLPEPRITAASVLLPDLALSQSRRAVLLHLGDTPLCAADAPILNIPQTRVVPDAESVLARAEDALHNLFNAAPPAPDPVPTDVLALVDRAATQGLVRAADAQRALHLLDEEPLIQWVRQAADPRVRYIPGLGLCAETLVSAIQEN